MCKETDEPEESSSGKNYKVTVKTNETKTKKWGPKDVVKSTFLHTNDTNLSNSQKDRVLKWKDGSQNSDEEPIDTRKFYESDAASPHQNFSSQIQNYDDLSDIPVPVITDLKTREVKYDFDVSETDSYTPYTGNYSGSYSSSESGSYTQD